MISDETFRKLEQDVEDLVRPYQYHIKDKIKFKAYAHFENEYRNGIVVDRTHEYVENKGAKPEVDRHFRRNSYLILLDDMDGSIWIRETDYSIKLR